MDSWTRGRVALVGDAGYCPGPAVGGSTSLAVVGAYVLAGELAAAGGDHAARSPRTSGNGRLVATAGRSRWRRRAWSRPPAGVWALVPARGWSPRCQPGSARGREAQREGRAAARLDAGQGLRGHAGRLAVVVGRLLDQGDVTGPPLGVADLLVVGARPAVDQLANDVACPACCAVSATTRTSKDPTSSPAGPRATRRPRPGRPARVRRPTRRGCHALRYKPTR